MIKHGDLPDLGEMDDNMGEYLKMTTYLDSEDPWFWEKLRYALPHRGRRRQQRPKRKRRNTETRTLLRFLSTNSKDSGHNDVAAVV